MLNFLYTSPKQSNNFSGIIFDTTNKKEIKGQPIKKNDDKKVEEILKKEQDEREFKEFLDESKKNDKDKDLKDIQGCVEDYPTPYNSSYLNCKDLTDRHKNGDSVNSIAFFSKMVPDKNKVKPPDWAIGKLFDNETYDWLVDPNDKRTIKVLSDLTPGKKRELDEFLYNRRTKAISMCNNESIKKEEERYNCLFKFVNKRLEFNYKKIEQEIKKTEQEIKKTTIDNIKKKLETKLENLKRKRDIYLTKFFLKQDFNHFYDMGSFKDIKDTNDPLIVPDYYDMSFNNFKLVNDSKKKFIELSHSKVNKEKEAEKERRSKYIPPGLENKVYSFDMGQGKTYEVPVTLLYPIPPTTATNTDNVDKLDLNRSFGQKFQKYSQKFYSGVKSVTRPITRTFKSQSTGGKNKSRRRVSYGSTRRPLRRKYARKARTIKH